jgi:hypothetical protein
MSRYDKLKNANEKLAKLLADPQFGLFSWQSAVLSTVCEINQAMEESPKVKLSDLQPGDRFNAGAGPHLRAALCAGLWQDKAFLDYVPAVSLRTGTMFLFPPTDEVTPLVKKGD